MAARAWINELGYYVRLPMNATEQRWFYANRYRDVGGCASATIDATAKEGLTWWEAFNRRAALLQMAIAGSSTARALLNAERP